MKTRRRSPVLCWLSLCAAMILFVGTVSLFAQEQIDPAQNLNVADIEEQTVNRPGGGVIVNPGGVLARYAV